MPSAPVIAVVNMKGGVGKTTISGNVFREVFRALRKNVLLIDFDPQYNLSQLLVTRAQYEKYREDRRTLWHVMNPEGKPSIFTVSENDLTQPDPVDRYVVRLRWLRQQAKIVNLDMLPGDFRTASLNLIADYAGLRVRRQRFMTFIQDARNVYDLVVLDCNPSSSFMTRAAIEAATHLLVPVRADKYSILGLEMLREFIRGLPGLERPPQLMIVVNDVLNAAVQDEVIDQLRSHGEYGPRTLAATIRHSAVLAAKTDYSGFAVDRKVPYSDTVAQRLRTVALEIATKAGLPQ